jgi:hypothetical protein
MKYFFCLLVLSALANLANAQTYSLNKFTIAGGGGLSSTGGVYSVSDTVGQADASGPLSGGAYTLVGGFWAMPVAVQTVGAPLLTIARATPGQATISWAPSTAGFVLQETLSLSPTNWINSATGATNPITVPANLPQKLYRLQKP